MARRIAALVADASNAHGNEEQTIHVHNAPDIEDPADWEPFGCSSLSYFSNDGASYRQALSRSNVFICPRFTEGIGMAMLEALSKGMLVIAHDEPTANEYISHRVNGILLNFRALTDVSLKPIDPLAIGAAARKFYIQGVESWISRIGEIRFLVKTTPRPDLRSRETAMADDFLRSLKSSRRKPKLFLRELKILRRKGLTGRENSAVSNWMYEDLGDRFARVVEKYRRITRKRKKSKIR